MTFAVKELTSMVAFILERFIETESDIYLSGTIHSFYLLFSIYFYESTRFYYDNI